MDLGALISEKRKMAGITIEQLASLSGVPKGTLNKIINGITRDPQLETVKAIARALDCTLDDFDDGPRPRSLSADEDRLAREYRLLDEYGREAIAALVNIELRRVESVSSTGKTPIEFPTKVPFKISDQPASAGTGVYLGPDGFSTHMVDPAAVQGADFGVPVRGDSMEPLYHDGDIILVSMSEPVEAGDIALVTMDGCGYVKKIGDGVLISVNHHYDPLPMTEDIRINGKVMGVLAAEAVS